MKRKSEAPHKPALELPKSTYAVTFGPGHETKVYFLFGDGKLYVSDGGSAEAVA